MRAFVCACVYVCVRAFVCSYVRASVRARQCTHVAASRRIGYSQQPTRSVCRCTIPMRTLTHVSEFEQRTALVNLRPREDDTVAQFRFVRQHTCCKSTDAQLWSICDTCAVYSSTMSVMECARRDTEPPVGTSVT